MRKISFSGVQQLGRALMLPIAVLPVAALLLRFGQDDLLNLPFVANAGAAIFSNLGLLFAIGIAVGFAKENNGAAGLAGAVGYFVAVKGAESLLALPAGLPELKILLSGIKNAYLIVGGGHGPNTAVLDLGLANTAVALAKFTSDASARMSVPVGILTGLTAGMIYNRYHAIKLPEYLAFFGGRRFVPIATGFVCLFWAAIFGLSWPTLSAGLDGFSRLLSQSGETGLFVYGALNRLLIMTGLHHIINNVVWFLHGSYTFVQNGVSTVVTGDLTRFANGDPTAGAFMAGFFPVMMFGLPAACLAMYRNAKPENKAAVGGVLLSMALTSFLTGITEPIEFAFMFLAPVLYVIHALLTGLSLVIMDVLNVKLGFGFSAGLIDYVINFNKATNPWMLIPVGAAYFVIYFLMFDVVIRKFNLKTIGREVMTTFGRPLDVPVGDEKTVSMIRALGGVANLKSVDACTTRLRLEVSDNTTIDEVTLKELGARGFVRPDAGTLQVILGPIADTVASDIRSVLQRGGASVEVGSSPSAAASAPMANVAAPVPAAPIVSGSARIDPAQAAAILAALGGAGNVKSLAVEAITRVKVVLNDVTKTNKDALMAAGVPGVMALPPDAVHLVVGKNAAAVADSVRILV